MFRVDLHVCLVLFAFSNYLIDVRLYFLYFCSSFDWDYFNSFLRNFVIVQEYFCVCVAFVSSDITEFISTNSFFGGV